MEKEKKDKVVAFRVSPSEMSKLHEEAKAKGINLNKLMRGYITGGGGERVNKEVNKGVNKEVNKGVNKEPNTVNTEIGKVKCMRCNKVVNWDKVNEIKAFLGDYMIKVCPHCSKWNWRLTKKGWIWIKNK